MAATINLGKGARINLTKKTHINKVEIGLGWVVGDSYKKEVEKFNDKNRNNKMELHDLDITAFMADKNRIVNDAKDVVYYRNKVSRDGSITSSGDNRTGGTTKGDVQETISIDLSKVSPEINHIIITVTIDDYEDRRQNFGQLSSAFVQITNLDNGEIPYSYELDNQFTTESAVTFIELTRDEDEWDLIAVGDGFHGGLAAKCIELGMDVG